MLLPVLILNNIPWQGEQSGWLQFGPLRPVTHTGGTPQLFFFLHRHFLSTHTGSCPSLHTGHLENKKTHNIGLKFKEIQINDNITSRVRV